MTFSEILAELYEELGYQSTPATAVATRVKRKVNRAHEAVLSEPSLASLLRSTLALASVASQARYGLSNVATLRSVTNATDERTLHRRSLAWYRGTNPDPTNNEGTPWVYVPLGLVAVAQVPAATGTGLWAVSSSASDTAGPTVTIDALRLGGYPHSPTAVALTGTARVAIGTLTDYIDVTQFQLSAACVGDISLYDAAAAGNLLAVIPRGQTSSRYQGLILSPTPSAAETFTLDVESEIQSLVNDDDEPRLPHKFHRVVLIRARMLEYEGKDDGRYTIAATEYMTELQKLKGHVNAAPDYVLVPGGGRSGRSDLGPEYPAGTIWD